MATKNETSTHKEDITQIHDPNSEVYEATRLYDSFHGYYVERRSHPRIALSLKVVLISENRIFKTNSLNISLGGMLLNMTPPKESLNPELKLLVENHDGSKSIFIKVNLLKDDSKVRLIFVEIKESDRIELQQWLDCELTRRSTVRLI